MFSQLNLFKISCFFSPLLLPSQIFWDLYQASNLKWAHFVYQIVQFLRFNICYVLYVLLWIKYWIMWFESLLFTFTFTFMHLADAFIQSDLQLHSGYTFSLVHVFPGNRTHNLLRSWRNALTTEPHRNTYFLFYSNLKKFLSLKFQLIFNFVYLSLISIYF